MYGISENHRFVDDIHLSRSGHSGHSGNHQVWRSAQSEDCAGVCNKEGKGSVKQALVNEIKVTLMQRFDLRLSSMAVAGANTEEQASNDLAGAVSTALHSLGTLPAQDAVNAVNDTAEGSIQQSTQALQQSGNTAQGLDDIISRLRDQLKALFSAFLSNAGSAQAATNAVSTNATMISNARGVLEIHTQEGDTITLRFVSKNMISMHDLQLSAGATQLKGSEVQVFSKSSVTMAMQGDLNSNELKAVQDLVNHVSQLADGFFSGDVNAALSQADALSFDGSQLADYSLSLKLKERFEAYGLNLSLPPTAELQTPTVEDTSVVMPKEQTTPPTADVTTTAAEPTSTATNTSPEISATKGSVSA